MGAMRWAALALLLLCGCGLGDYEKRMDEQRERLARLDEEALLLGDLIDMPSGKDAYGNDIKVPFAIFLRVPKGVSGAFKGREAVYYGDKQPLYRYYGKSDLNVFIALALTPDMSAPGKAKEDEISPDIFAARVRSGLQDFVRREYSLNANPPDSSQLKKEAREVLRNNTKITLNFLTLTFDNQGQQGPTRFSLFFSQKGNRQAAVIYQYPQTLVTDQQFQRMLDYSLKTLEISYVADSLRTSFKNKK